MQGVAVFGKRCRIALSRPGGTRKNLPRLSAHDRPIRGWDWIQKPVSPYADKHRKNPDQNLSRQTGKPYLIGLA